MSHPDVVAAVNARLAALWDEIPIPEPNKSGKAPADGSPFLAVQFFGTTPQQWSTDGLYREQSAFRFVLNLERGTGQAGVDAGLAMAERLAALFRGQEFDGVFCQSPGTPAMDDGNDNGNYFVVAFAVPYYFNFQG